MRSILRQKILNLLYIAAIFINTWAFGQFKNFGTKAKVKPQSNFIVSAYGYYDIVREYGIGLQYQFLPAYSIDFGLYTVNPTPYFKDKILQWDYYDLKGYGISFKPKFHLNVLGQWYVSPNISFEWLKHDKTWVEEMVYYHEIVHYLTETKGKAYTIGWNFGRKIMINRVFLEPFIGVGLTSFKAEKITYEIDRPSLFPSQTFPETESYRQDYLQINIGLKLGVAFKKSKQLITIDKEFDRVYLAKSDSLSSFFKTVSKERLQQNKQLRMAFRRYKALNRHALMAYKKHYYNHEKLYLKIDELFIIIDSLRYYGIPEKR